ncbi:hypothetical protein KFK09_011110 [Dendrobium nobile]|uniref:Uncharacterized protein n=1 Tax=Dendrobium nobile TaxID=94219 RepID=A0A8T3BE13_DENNO|nr:hypothetical protein KFK09_011102 [Dendrobium nobile]KAI0510506.1 hypothetical protein KFK09_011110 [Dendrobium nobile]
MIRVVLPTPVERNRSNRPSRSLLPTIDFVTRALPLLIYNLQNRPCFVCFSRSISLACMSSSYEG